MNKQDSENEVIIGIDLGTTNSLAAIMTAQGPQALRDEQGVALIPSIVSFKNEKLVIGENARQIAELHPKETIFSIKRLMGKSLADIQEEKRILPYTLIEDGAVLKIRVKGKTYTPQELSAFILKEVKIQAERALGKPVRKAVLTVPAYFSHEQRQATSDAGRIAGLDVLRIVNEPTAAALAYGLDRNHEGTVVVYDMGGGTFDVSILKIEDGVFRVLATAGDTALGGDDFDRQIMFLMIRGMIEQYGFDVHQDASALQAVKKIAEEAKKQLTRKVLTELSYLDSEAKIAFSRQLSQDEFENLAQPLVARSLVCCRRALDDAGLNIQDVDDVVLVGGSTRMPVVRSAVETFFQRKPHTELHPDEVVALGAAVQAHILAGGTRDILLMDVTPLSLGIETAGAAFSKIIMRNTAVPSSASDEFSTSVDNLTKVSIHVLQGEREMVGDCLSLGKFILTGIPPMPAGLPRIEVNFSLDVNGMLTVRALEKRSNIEAHIEVVPSHSLTREEVDRIVEESITHALDDFSVRKLVEIKNKAQTILRATDRSLPKARQEKLISEDELQRILKIREEVKSLIDDDTQDLDRLEDAVDTFGSVTAHLAEAMMNAAVRDSFKGKTVHEMAESMPEEMARTESRVAHD